MSSDDRRNAQAAMSRFAGELALLDALKHYEGTAAKKVTIIGTGPAGLSAALCARKLQLPVQLFGRKEQYRNKIESSGIEYHVLPIEKQCTFIHKYLTNQTIIITAARVIGEKSPILIDEESFALLPADSVIVDLSAGEGGSVVGSRQDVVKLIERGIKIVNISGYPKMRPKEASAAFADCMIHLLQTFIDSRNEVALDNSLLEIGNNSLVASSGLSKIFN